MRWICWMACVGVLSVGCSESAEDGGKNPGGAGTSGSGSGGTPMAGGGGAMGGQGARAGGAGQSGAGGLGELCAFTDLTTNFSAIEADECTSGYCLWDSRGVSDSYCTIACSGPDGTCPAPYECVEDEFATGKYWCARPVGGVPDDLGAACPAPSNSYCYNSTYPTESYCVNIGQMACESHYCVGDPISNDSYCSLPCNQTDAPCPEGWDCKRAISSSDHDFCIRHHEPMEYTGLPCYEGSRNCTSGPCPTVENQTTYSCAPYGLGLCMFDSRMGRTYLAYCTARCEDTPCPAGFTCMPFETTSNNPPSGQYCVQTL